MIDEKRTTDVTEDSASSLPAEKLVVGANDADGVIASNVHTPPDPGAALLRAKVEKIGQ
jgi:hypothetical protein